MILMVFSGLVITIYISVKYFKYINFKLLIVPLVLSLCTTYFGLKNVVSIDNDIYVRVLGAGLIVLSIYFFFFLNKIKIPANQWTAASAGIISGLMNGFFSIPGSPIVLYYSAANEDKRGYIAATQVLFLSNSILKAVFFAIQYEISSQVSKLIPFTITADVAGTLIGNKAFKKRSFKSLKKVVYVVMVLAGFKYLVF